MSSKVIETLVDEEPGAGKSVRSTGSSSPSSSVGFFLTGFLAFFLIADVGDAE